MELESISPSVIKGLCNALKDRSKELRETAAGALGKKITKNSEIRSEPVSWLSRDTISQY